LCQNFPAGPAAQPRDPQKSLIPSAFSPAGCVGIGQAKEKVSDKLNI
jgi:hypothetical protein